MTNGFAPDFINALYNKNCITFGSSLNGSFSSAGSHLPCKQRVGVWTPQFPIQNKAALSRWLFYFGLSGNKTYQPKPKKSLALAAILSSNVNSKSPDVIIKYRIYFMLVIAAITVFMGYHASKVELVYDFRPATVPPNDPDMVFFNQFKLQFGEDGNVLAVGMKDSAIISWKTLKRAPTEQRLKKLVALKMCSHFRWWRSLGRIRPINASFEAIVSGKDWTQPNWIVCLSVARNQQFWRRQTV